MVYAKLKHFRVGYMRVRPFVHVVFLFGLTHNFFIKSLIFKELCCPIHDKLKESCITTTY